MGLGSTLADPSSILAVTQKRNIQTLTATASFFSIVACLFTIYWFLMMRRNFRRTLIMMLILADLFKSFWFLLFSAISLDKGGIATGAAFCYAGGFFIQAGLEACDISILFMSLHMAMQILPGKKGSRGNDGLYRWRVAVFALYIIVPSFMAGLAFVNTKGAYLSQGAFCTLPVRPFWYRLALSWIPRYIIWIYVMSVAFRIYRQVGTGFKVFARQHDYSSSKDEPSTPGASEVASSAIPNSRRDSRKPSIKINIKQWSDPFTSERSSSSAGPLPMPNSRRPSYVRWESDLESPIKEGPSTPGFATFPGLTEFPLPNVSNAAACANGVPTGTHHSAETKEDEVHPTMLLYPEAAAQRSGSAPTSEFQVDDPATKPPTTLTNLSDRSSDKRRRTILRQVRLLFIYPIVYMITMIFPFAGHCMSYSDYYAAHPNYILSALAPFCLTFLGFIDCLIFCWRERPWTNIPGSDGTVLGSFRFWRFNMAEDTYGAGIMMQLTRAGSNNTAPSEQHQRSSVARSSLKSAMRKSSQHKRIFSGNSDHAALEADRAQQRLALERAAYAQEHTITPSCEQSNNRFWFDVRVSEDGEEDDEEEESGSAINRHDSGNKKDTEMGSVKSHGDQC